MLTTMHACTHARIGCQLLPLLAVQPMARTWRGLQPLENVGRHNGVKQLVRDVGRAQLRIHLQAMNRNGAGAACGWTYALAATVDRTILPTAFLPQAFRCSVLPAMQYPYQSSINSHPAKSAAPSRGQRWRPPRF